MSFISVIFIPYADLKPIIWKYIHDKWQQTWKLQTQNKLYQIYPTIPSYRTLPTSYQRNDQIIYNRLCIGHTRLTHSYVIEHTYSLKCTNCNHLLSVKHVLTEYFIWSNTTSILFLYWLDIKNVFNHTSNKNVLNFV